ncbi:MAG TPA: hypothetical protein VEI97_00695, partial [bacterium]|nr:hypothetical protein [bacterium]
MRWYPLAAITAALVLAGCSSSTPTDPTPDTRGAVLGPQVGDPSGMVQSALGAWTLQVDPTSATAILELVRTGAATLYGQGQNYLLSVRPFFNPGDVSVRRVSVDPDGRLRVSVRVQHPFDVPADPTRPATATKRLDLHIAEAHLLLVADGSDTFFSGTPDGPVVVNHGLLSNAEGYRDPGPLFDPVAMGVASATAFPYRMLGDFDPVDPDGNYNPTGGGWQGAALLAPTGYGVFPMGADKTVDLVLNLQTGDTLDLGLVVLAKYQDPRGGTTAVQ